MRRATSVGNGGDDVGAVRCDKDASGGVFPDRSANGGVSVADLERGPGGEGRNGLAVDASAADVAGDDIHPRRFLSGMTFASMNNGEVVRDAPPRVSCDCDECFAVFAALNRKRQRQREQQQRNPDENGEGEGRGESLEELLAGDSFVPPSIALAVRQYKRARTLERGLRRTQHRRLVGREQVDDDANSNSNTQISVWEWTLPLRAEPWAEFGNSHRLVWIQRLPSATTKKQKSSSSCRSILQHIGKGIVGSRDEEMKRVNLHHWNEGEVYFLPSNGGKATGWVHSTAMNTTTSAATLSEEQETTTKEGGQGRESQGWEAVQVGTENDAAAEDDDLRGHVVLRVAKVPAKSIPDRTWVDNDDDMGVKKTETHPQKWSDTIYHVFTKVIRQQKKGRDKDKEVMKISVSEEPNLATTIQNSSTDFTSSTNREVMGVLLSDEDASIVRNCMTMSE